MVDQETKTYLQFLAASYATKARYFLLIFLLTGMDELTILAVPYLSGRAIDARHGSLSHAYGYAGLMLVLFLLRMFAITFVQDYVRITKLDYAIPRDAAHHVLRTLVGTAPKVNPQISMRMDATGIRALCSLTDAMIFDVFPSFTRILFISVSMAILSAELAALFLSTVAVYAVIAYLRHAALFAGQKDLERRQVDVNAMRGIVHERIGDEEGAHTALDDWLSEQIELDEARVRLALRGRAWDRFRNLPLRFGEVGVLVLGFWLESRMSITEGTLIACMMWARQGSQTVTSVGGLLAQFSDEWAQIKLLAELCRPNSAERSSS